jgi:hypothetical protein
MRVFVPNHPVAPLEPATLDDMRAQIMAWYRFANGSP